jgi:ABC-2 type transport system ATP-binding protein
MMIEADQLTKRYPNGVEAVRGVSFHVDPGEVFGLIGPNGAGKSTTIGMLTTTVLPTAGRATIAGFYVARSPIAARGLSAVVFQDAVVDQSLTGRQNLEIHARLWGVQPAAAKARIGEVVRDFRLAGLVDRPVGGYSGGERRRLEIARSLLSRPRVLFLDEPTVGLDPRIRFELLDLIAGLRRERDITIVLTTHYLEEAERLCDRVAIVHDGQVVALDTPRALLDALGSEIVEVRVDEARAVLGALRARGIAQDDAFAVGSTVSIPLHGIDARDAIDVITEVAGAAAGVTVRPTTLDDVYLQLTSKERT